MPAASRETGKERPGRGILVEMKGLRIELSREPFDLFGIEVVRRAREGLADMQIVEKEMALLTVLHSRTSRLIQNVQANNRVGKDFISELTRSVTGEAQSGLLLGTLRPQKCRRGNPAGHSERNG
jgi:hypothetical protein